MPDTDPKHTSQHVPAQRQQIPLNDMNHGNTAWFMFIGISEIDLFMLGHDHFRLSPLFAITAGLEPRLSGFKTKARAVHRLDIVSCEPYWLATSLGITL